MAYTNRHSQQEGNIQQGSTKHLPACRVIAAEIRLQWQNMCSQKYLRGSTLSIPPRRNEFPRGSGAFNFNVSEILLSSLRINNVCIPKDETLGAEGMEYIYMQSNKIHNVVLMSKFYSALFVSSTCFGPHRSIIRSVLYKLYSQTLVCSTTVRTTRHVPSSRYKVVGRTAVLPTTL